MRWSRLSYLPGGSGLEEIHHDLISMFPDGGGKGYLRPRRFNEQDLMGLEGVGLGVQAGGDVGIRAAFRCRGQNESGVI